jgi:hypothetical protein
MNGYNIQTCPVPSELADVDLSSTSVKLTWNEVNCAENYEVKYKVHGTGGWTEVTSSTNEVVINDLMPNTTYDWRLRTECSISPTDISEYALQQKFKTMPLLQGSLLRICLQFIQILQPIK